MSPGNQDEMELIRKLRAEWRVNWGELFEEQNKKGFTDPTARAKLDKIDTDLNAKTDAQIAAQQKRLDEQDAKIRAFGERGSRPPGGGGGNGDEVFKSLGQKFVESEMFKAAQFTGRFHIQVSLPKTRIKAVGTIIEGGPTVITPPAGAYPIFPRRVGLIPQRFLKPVMRDLIPVIPLDGTNAVEYVTEDWTLNADYQVLEGDKKPQSGVTYTDHTAVVRTIAHYIKISRQMASDVPFIMASIEQRLALGVLLKEDKEILYGDNSAGHLWGIMPQATPEGTYYPTPPATGSTAIDQLNAAETWVESQFYFPTAIVLNPTTWAAISGLKTSFGSYILNGLPQSEETPRLWGLPVITTPNMGVGDYLVGDFTDGCALFDRETVIVEIAFQNEDDFVRNLVTLRAEERVAFAVYVPKAFAKGPFVTPPITAPITATADSGKPSDSAAAHQPVITKENKK